MTPDQCEYLTEIIRITTQRLAKLEKHLNFTIERVNDLEMHHEGLVCDYCGKVKSFRDRETKFGGFVDSQICQECYDSKWDIIEKDPRKWIE